MTALHAAIVNNTEELTVVHARAYRADGRKRPVLWLHESGGDHLSPWKPANNCLPILRIVCALGLAVAVPRMGGLTTWGNDTAQTRITEALAYLRASKGASTTRDPLIIGVSMGGLAALTWMRTHPVKGLALPYPATSLQAIHDGAGGAADGHVNIEAAYGGLAAFNAAAAAHDPAQHAADFAGKKIKAWYSSADAVVGTANQESFFTAANIDATSLGPVTHADMTKLPLAEVAAFVRSV